MEITHFVPDSRTAGGAYEVTTCVIKKLDYLTHLAKFAGGGEIRIDRIIEISDPAR